MPLSFKQFASLMESPEQGGVHTPFEISPNKEVQRVIDVFGKSGVKIYIVGGAVRDSWLNHFHPDMAPQIKDFDLATPANPEMVKRILTSAGIKFGEVGAAFGVIVAFIPKGNDQYEEIEIATFRKDIGKGRRPDSVEFTDLQTDTSRRDLTMNAMAYDPTSKQTIDYHGGLDHLKNKQVRTVNDPNARFDEDPLRVLRYVRFFSRMNGGGPNQIDDDHQKALIAFKGMEGVSPERIREEFAKGLKSAVNISNYLDIFQHFGLFDRVFPGLHVNKEYPDSRNIFTVLGFLLKDNDTDKLRRSLNQLTWPIPVFEGVPFLLDIKRLSRQNASQLFYPLKKKYEKQLKHLMPEHMLKEWAIAADLDQKLINAFDDFKLEQKVSEVPGADKAKGPEIGKIIEKHNTDKFIRTIA